MTNNQGLLGDSPIIESLRADKLKFTNMAKVLAGATVESKNPLTIGVYGKWGTGKTSLMRLIRQEVDKHDAVTISVWFNAWQFEKEEHLIVPLIATINREIEESIAKAERDRSELKSLKLKARRAFIASAKTLHAALRSVAWGVSMKSKVGVSGLGEIDASFAGKEMINRYQELTKDSVLARSLYFDAFKELRKISSSEREHPRIVIFIDDLDRCFPSIAVQLLESIKLILHQPGFAFVLGVNDGVIRRFVASKYQREFGDGTKPEVSEKWTSEQKGLDEEYLDKIVQMHVYVPARPSEAMADYVKALLVEAGVLAEFTSKIKEDRLLKVIADAGDRNPRSIVRLLNGLIVARRIQESEYGSADSEISLLALLIQTMVQEYIHSEGRFGPTSKLIARIDSRIEPEKNAPSLGRALADGFSRPSVQVDQDQGSLIGALREVVTPAPMVNDAINLLQFREPLTRVLLTEDGRRWLSDKKFRDKLGFAVQSSSKQKDRKATQSVGSGINGVEWAIHELESYMKDIPGDTFLMGEGTKRIPVTISPFRISKYQVTQEIYEAIMGMNPSSFKGPRNPVESVSWEEATNFCERLCSLTGQRWRLPTEAEWEYACRAGSESAYCFGNEDGDLGKYAWFKGKNSSESGTHPVGERNSNVFGLHDMHGNVWEWCSDWYGSSLSGGSDPTGPSGGSSRVIRGGGWSSVARNCRSAIRAFGGERDRDNALGFRVVVNVD